MGRVGAHWSREWRTKHWLNAESAIGLWGDSKVSEFLGLLGVWIHSLGFSLQCTEINLKQLNQKRVFLRKQGYFLRSWSHVLESWQKVPCPSGLSYPVSASSSSYYFSLLFCPLITPPLSPLSFVEENGFSTAPEFACYTVCMTEFQLYQRLNLHLFFPVSDFQWEESRRPAWNTSYSN